MPVLTYRRSIDDTSHKRSTIGRPFLTMSITMTPFRLTSRIAFYQATNVAWPTDHVPPGYPSG
jgi:hypothetical protein